jgi:hypothetical protein
MTEHNEHVGIFQRATHTNLEARCLIIPLSHNWCLAEFCTYQVIKHHDIHFLSCCLIYLYVVLNGEKFSKKELHVRSMAIPRIIYSLVQVYSCLSYTWQCGRADMLT